MGRCTPFRKSALFLLPRVRPATSKQSGQKVNSFPFLPSLASPHSGHNNLTAEVRDATRPLIHLSETAGGHVKISRFILAFLTTLVLIMPLTVSAEDMSETAYDKSETQPLASAPRVSKARVSRPGNKSTSDEPEPLPCDETPLLSVPVPEALAQAPDVRKRIPPLGLSSLTLAARNRDHWMHSFCRISASLIIVDYSLRC